MRVALVDASIKSDRYPLGLLRLSTMLKTEYREIKIDLYRKSIPNKPYDKILVSTLFTYEIAHAISIIKKCKQFSKSIFVGGISASLMPNIFRMLGVQVEIGLHKNAEFCTPDYTLVDNDYSIVHTSRGCVRKCGFCAVPKIEGKYVDKNWGIDDVNRESKKIYFYDNNYTVKTPQKMVKDLKILEDIFKRTNIKRTVFDQAIDCRLVTEDKADILTRMNLDICCFAFDGMHEDGHIQKAVKIMADRGEKKFYIYCLYNFEDTPKDFYFRIKECIRMGEELGVSVTAYPMRYQPVMTFDKTRSYVGKYWTKKEKKGFMHILENQSIFGQISQSTVKDFEYWFGKDEKEFLKLISYDNISIYSKRKKAFKKSCVTTKKTIDR